VALLVVLGTAIFVRWPFLDSDGFWYDELLTVEFMTGRGDVPREFPVGRTVTPVPDSLSLEGAPPVWAIWTTLNGTVHPPLYYLAVRVWAEVVGDSDAAVRGWSMACGVAGIAVLWQLVRREHGAVAAGLAAAIMALAGPQVFFSHEARHYAQATLTLLLTAWAAWPTGKRLPWWRAGLVGLGLLGSMLTHYFTAGVCLAIVVAAWLRTDPPQRRRVLAATAGAAGVFLVVWGPQLWRQLHDGFATTSWVPVNDRRFVDAAGHFLHLPLGAFIYTYGQPIGVLAAGWAMWLVPLARTITADTDRRRLLLPWVLWFPLGILPTVLLELIDGREVMAYPRWVFVAAPGLIVGLTIMLTDVDRRWLQWLVPAGVAVMCGIELGRPYQRNLPEYQNLGRLMAGDLERGDHLYLTHSPDIPWLHCGVFRGLSRYGFDDELRSVTVVEQDAPRRVPAEIERLWLFTPLVADAWQPAGMTLVASESVLPLGALSLWQRSDDADAK
jgi:hypothetical protein